MNEKDIMKLAQLVRDGKATEQEKLQLLQALNIELKEVSTILEKASQKNK